MNIAQILSQQARARGDAPAIIDRHNGQDRAVSFRELEDQSARIAALLEAHGIGAGDAVLLLHPMSAELYAFLIAVFRLGAVATVLDPAAGRRPMEQCLRMVPPKAFFGSAKAHLLRLLSTAMRRVPVAFCTSRIPGAVHISLAAQIAPRSVIEPVADSHPALITFTSGSTGEPKAAVRSHGFLLAQHSALQASLHHQTGDLDLTTLPVFVLSNLASGITSVVPDCDLRRPGAIRPEPVIGQLQRLPIATLAASPAFVRRLQQACDDADLQLHRVQRVFLGGAPVFPDDLRGAHALFPSAEITAVYGSTEAEPIADLPLSAISAEDFAAMERGHGLLAGLPVPSITLRIFRNQWGQPISPLDPAQFNADCLAAEAVGEIVVAGPHVLGGYLRGAGDAETKFRVGAVTWHRTGDLGRLDHRGRLWLMGRASAIIEDDRGVLYPFCVECAARQVPGVRHGALISASARRVLAFEGERAVSTEDVRSHLAWAQLDEVRRVRAIPMDKRHNAKVDYVALRRMIARS